MHTPQLVGVTTLGENNCGSIGPKGTPEEIAQKTDYMAQELQRPEYSKPASNRWVCVDGRGEEGFWDAADAEMADPQTAGSIVLTELGAELMLVDEPETVSQITARKTQEAIANGLEPVFHGDEAHGMGGCGLNNKKRDILRHNAANIDIVVPKIWDLVKGLSIDEYAQIDDVTEMIVRGAKNADNDQLWDATPEQLTQIGIDNGATYVTLLGAHEEAAVRVDLSENAYDEAAFVRDHKIADRTPGPEAFNASAGLLKKYYFDQAAEGKMTMRDAALRTIAAIALNVGTPKDLGNENIPVIVVK